jgi:hypothetical protein
MKGRKRAYLQKKLALIYCTVFVGSEGRNQIMIFRKKAASHIRIQ